VTVAVALAVLTAGCASDPGGGSQATVQPAPTTSSTPSTEAAAAWERRDQLNTPRDDFGTVVVDDRIWVTGGMTGGRGNKLGTTEIFDPVTDNWTFGPPLPTARSSLTTVILDGVIYAMGGARADVPVLDIVEALDTETETWERLTPMSTGRYEHGSAVLDGKIYVIGGNAEDGDETSSVEIFDPATGQWSEGPSLSVARSALRVTVLDGKIYAAGGLNASGILDVVEVYDPAVGEWQLGPSLPEPILNFGLTAYDGEVHAIYHQYHFVLGPDDTEWRDEGSPPIIRHGIGLIELDGLLYAIGGCTEEPLVDVNTVQVWQG